jgi:hypothetical protein
MLFVNLRSVEAISLAPRDASIGSLMRELDGRTLLSASDVVRFMGCAHVTALDLAYMRGKGPEPRDDSEDGALLQKQGDAHEVAHLERFQADGRAVIEIKRGGLCPQT